MLLEPIKALGYRVSLHEQEDGRWVASAKLGQHGKPIFTYGPTALATATSLAKATARQPHPVDDDDDASEPVEPVEPERLMLATENGPRPTVPMRVPVPQINTAATS